MLDDETARRWGALPGFSTTARHWTWYRDALPPLLERLARRTSGSEVGVMLTVDADALAKSFWAWVSRLDNERRFEPLDPVDFAHYSCGVLLVELLTHQPLRDAGDNKNAVLVLTDAALTLLAALRLALGASPLSDDIPARIASKLGAYIEDITKDPNSAVPYLDLFTGREPVWQFPMMASARPPIARALVARRNTHY